MDDAGIDCESWAENVAPEFDSSFSDEDADSIVVGWIGFPGHRTNLLGDYDEHGIGVEVRDDGGVVATQLLRSNA